jgi:lambda family phage portal protein
MSGAPVLVQAEGPMRIQEPGSRKVTASFGYGYGGMPWSGIRESAYDGASTHNPDLSGYQPFNYSPQAALSLDKDALGARVHDMARNDGWASAAVARQVDSIIGSGWRLTSKPDAIALGISPEAAGDLAIQIESAWRLYSTDEEQCDVGQRLSVGGLLAVGFRHRCQDGEALGAILWRDRGHDFSTCFQVIHPDRLSTPYGHYDTTNFRQGIELGPDGEPLAYHIRCQHPGDIGILDPDSYRWDRVARKLPNGRRQIVHAYEPLAADMVRGAPPLAPVIQKLHMLGRYDKAELQAAVLNAVLAAVVTSNDQEQAAKALQGHNPLAENGEDFTGLQAARSDFYSRGLNIPGAQVSYLYPTDKLELTRPQHPNSGFEQFYRTGLRNVAAAAGVTYEQLSNDWSQTNYSSARAGLLEIWKGFTARGDNFGHQYLGPFFAAWLEEAIARGKVKLPKGAPEFRAARTAYCQARWIGPARGWVDPKKEAEAAILRMGSGLSTLERECADQGQWWVDVVQQRARERRMLIAEGLDPDTMLRPKLPTGTQAGDGALPAPPAAPTGPSQDPDEEVEPS